MLSLFGNEFIALTLSVIVAALVVRFVAILTPTLVVKDWGIAILAGIVLLVLSLLAQSVEGTFLPKAAAWQVALYHLVFNTVTVSIVGLVLPGMALRGFAGVLLAGVFFTIIDFAKHPVVAALAGAGLSL